MRALVLLIGLAASGLVRKVRTDSAKVRADSAAAGNARLHGCTLQFTEFG